MDEKIIDILKNVEGISISDGLTYCGSSSAYVKFVKSFYGSIDKKAAEIEEAYQKEDIALFTTKVHSLKSTSRIVGAAGLSELALKLEDAGRSGDTTFIKANTDEFLKLYRSYRDKLSVIETADECEPADPISEEELADAYQSLADNIKMQDYDAVELILSEIKKFRLPDSDKHVIDKLDSLLKEMDWEEMSEVILLQK